jgi:hypothetical protein
MKPIKYVVGVCFSVMAMRSYGQALPLVWCDGCSTAQQATLAGAQVTSGTVYVGNTDAGTVHAFNVYIDENDGTSPPTRTKVADPVAGTSPYNQVGQAMINFHRQSPQGWHKSVVLTLDGNMRGAPYAKSLSVPYPDPTANVYTVINSGPNQVKLTNWAGGLVSTAFNAAGSFLSSIGASFKLADVAHAPKIEVEVEFNDGSHIDLNEDFSSTNPKITVDNTSGIDSHNNHVPATRSAATCSAGGDHGVCEYSFNGPGNAGDYQNWKNQMGLLGVSVGGSSSGGGQWACVKVGDGDSAVYTCTYQ